MTEYSAPQGSGLPGSVPAGSVPAGFVPAGSVPGQSAPQHVAPAGQPLARVPWGAVGLFVAVAYGLGWLVMLPLWQLRSSGEPPSAPVAQLLASLLPSVMMFTPAVAMLVVVFALRTPRSGRARFLGVWPLRPAKRVVWMMVLAAVAPMLVVALALGVAWGFGWYTPDFPGLSGLTMTLTLGGTPPELVQTVFITQLVLIPLAGLLNLLPALGEEIGWRGWLLPALMPLGTWPALCLSGVVWGLWHTPVTLLGHNFGLYDWRGVALMTVGCTFWGVLFGWLRLRSASVWPAAIAHGALNGAAGMFAVFAMAGAPLPLVLVNPLGVSGWIVAAILIAVLAATGQFRRQPALAPPRG